MLPLPRPEATFFFFFLNQATDPTQAKTNAAISQDVPPDRKPDVSTQQNTASSC